MSLYDKYSKYKSKYIYLKTMTGDSLKTMTGDSLKTMTGDSLKTMTGGNLSNLVVDMHVENSKSTGKKFVITTAGGGYSAGYYVMSQVGASNTVLELNGPYAREASKEFLKKPDLEKFADLPAANEFAITSLKRSRDLITMTKNEITELDTLDNCYGIGIASSLVSKDYKRGFHQCNMVVLSNNSKYTIQIQFKKGTTSKHLRTRTEEDNICGNILVIVMAFVCGIINKDRFDNLIKDNSGLNFETPIITSETQLKYGDITNARDDESLFDKFIFNLIPVNTPINRLLKEDDNEKVNSVLCISKDREFKYIINAPIHNLGKYLESTKPTIVSLPGSFNPLHNAHSGVLNDSIAKVNNGKGIYDLSVFNVDKGSISIDTILERLEQFKTTIHPIMITNAPRFIDKARLFPGISYVIGIDTAIRLIDPVYTDGNLNKMMSTLFEIFSNGTKFFVNPINFDTAGINPKYGLVKQSNGIVTLEDINHFIPSFFREYFIGLDIKPEYASVSSSEIRKGKTYSKKYEIIKIL
jgi:hypothetical protein